MIEFTKLNINDSIYIIDDDPISILEVKISDIGYSNDYKRRIKVYNNYMSFELDFEDIKDRSFKNKDQAYAVAIKYIFDETNKYIRRISDGRFIDYFELDKAIEIYKQKHPEIFI